MRADFILQRIQIILNNLSKLSDSVTKRIRIHYGISTIGVFLGQPLVNACLELPGK